MRQPRFEYHYAIVDDNGAFFSSETGRLHIYGNKQDANVVAESMTAPKPYVRRIKVQSLFKLIR